MDNATQDDDPIWGERKGMILASDLYLHEQKYEKYFLANEQYFHPYINYETAYKFECNIKSTRYLTTKLGTAELAHTKPVHSNLLTPARQYYCIRPLGPPSWVDRRTWKRAVDPIRNDAHQDLSEQKNHMAENTLKTQITKPAPAYSGGIKEKARS